MLLTILATLCVTASAQEPPVPEPPEPIHAVLAVHGLPRGHVIVRDDLALVILPEPPAFTAFTDPDAIIGQVVKEDILADELVRVERLAVPDDSRVGLEGRIPRGARVLAVRPRVASDPMAAGSRADVWWGQKDAEPGCWIASDVAVLGTVNPEGGISVADRHPSTLWIVVGVSPADASLIEHGSVLGEITTRSRTKDSPPLSEEGRCREPMSVYLQ